MPLITFEFLYSTNNTFYGAGPADSTADDTYFKDHRLPVDVFFYAISSFPTEQCDALIADQGPWGQSPSNNFIIDGCKVRAFHYI